MRIEVREMCFEEDAQAVWSIMEPIIRAGETYALPTDWDQQHALSYWCDASHTVFVAVELPDSTRDESNHSSDYASEKGIIVGTYFLHANQKGNGSHVANCGYMTAQGQHGKGIARFMCQHSLQEAKRRSFHAMQYNFVIQSNERAVKLWQYMGFNIIGCIPKAFQHPRLGLTDVYIMHQFLV